MEADRFDTLVRSLGAGLSRRRLGAVVLAALGLGTGEADAARHRHHHHRGHHSDDAKSADAPVSGAKTKKPKCKPKCRGKTCGSDGCGDSCGKCAKGFVCSNTAKGGTCRCPSGTTCKGGKTCCSANQTCLDGQCCPNARVCKGKCCDTNQTCVDGTCCPDDRACKGACCATDEQCVADSCCSKTRVCGETCCDADEPCISDKCCPKDLVCKDACCNANDECLGDECCASTDVCGDTCCNGDRTCVDQKCCDNDRLCNDSACCDANQTCLATGCCPENKACNGVCCSDDETCIGEGAEAHCCPQDDVCNGETCCGADATCTTQGGCCAVDRACHGKTCCAADEDCLGDGCCAADRVCNGTECCGENQTCTTERGCCPAARVCGDGATCCGASETCVENACCAAPCGDICCAGNQQCIAGSCCPEAKLCGDACCAENESCVAGRCEQNGPPAPFTCDDCGFCQRCAGNSDTGNGECGKNCSDCLAQTLCRVALSDPHATVLTQHLQAQGYRQIAQPVASVLEEEGSASPIASAVSIQFAHPTDDRKRVSIAVRVDAQNRVKTRGLVTRDTQLQEVIEVHDNDQGGDPEVVTLQATITYSPGSGDESQVSNATCAVCSSLCNWSMDILNFADTLEKLTGIKDAIATMMTGWPKVGRWLVDSNAEEPKIEELLDSADAVEKMHDVLSGQFAAELSQQPAPPGPERCAGCSADGFCCQSGRRVCPSDDPLEFSGCVDEGGCCENGVEGTCPPGIGSVCSDFRSDRVNCGGCPGQGGTDCTGLGPDVQCRNRVCEFTGCPIGQVLCGGRCHQPCGANELMDFAQCQCGPIQACEIGDAQNTIGKRCADGTCTYLDFCCPEENAAGGTGMGGCLDPDRPLHGSFCCGLQGGTTPLSPCRELCPGTDCKIICRPAGMCPSCFSDGCCTAW